MPNKSEKTHFGYQQVDVNEKTEKVGHVFQQVAPYYDLMNDVMSLGMHHIWKRKFIQYVSPIAGQSYLDVAGGSGDIMLKIAQKIQEESDLDQSKLVMSDINPDMLKTGQKKLIDHGFGHIKTKIANAEELPFEDHQFDNYTISFGLRNVTNIEKALAEAYRTLEYGGQFFCLEFSHVSIGWLAKLYDVYSFSLIPKFGEWVAKDAESYQYLVESIRKFPTQQRLCDMLEKVGFKQVSYTNLTGGVVAIHKATKI